MVKKISYVDLGISVNHDELKTIIDKWQSGQIYKNNYALGYRGEDLYRNILNDIVCSAEDLEYDIEKKTLKDFGLCRDQLDWYKQYQRTDIRSIGWAVLDLLNFVVGNSIERLTTDDIPIILEFLDTPPGKSLEAWEKWEQYWNNLDYPVRRKKLLDNPESL